MPRVYKRKLGSRKYQDYCDADLKECLDAVKSGRMTQQEAAKMYNVSRRTINYKLSGKHCMKPGKPPIFSPEEETQFLKCVLQMSDFGFPITEIDLRNIVQHYLSKIGRVVKEFRNGNYPGNDWVKGFLKRHPELSVRFVANIKKARASVDEEMLREYITNLIKTMENVVPENVYNFDETNLTDDPGSKRCVVKRGTKYPAVIRNTSKTSISIMMAGNAVGELLPPFVVYKASSMWMSWCEGGPKGARFTSTASGWFDGNAFEEWFFSLMLPCLKKKQGIKVLLGDNLSSHVSAKVLEACDRYEIRFACLPPNSTHLTQPLDVAFFKPLKSAWRKILADYKDSAVGRNKTSIEKQHFPSLLKRLLEALEPNREANLKSGFKKCSVHPINIDELLKAFSVRKVYDTDAIEDSFKLFLEKKTEVVTGTEGKRKRRKKINVPAGKSVCAEDLVEPNTEIPVPGTSTGTSETVKVVKKKTKTLNVESDSDIDDVENVSYRDSTSSAEENFSDLEANSTEKQSKDYSNGSGDSWMPVRREVNEYVIFTYEEELFPGTIVKVEDDGAVVRSMQKCGNAWKWPDKHTDELFYEWKDILGHINKPKKLSKTRNIFQVPELSFKWDFL